MFRLEKALTIETNKTANPPKMKASMSKYCHEVSSGWSCAGSLAEMGFAGSVGVGVCTTLGCDFGIDKLLVEGVGPKDSVGVAVGTLAGTDARVGAGLPTVMFLIVSMLTVKLYS